MNESDESSYSAVNPKRGIGDTSSNAGRPQTSPVTTEISPANSSPSDGLLQSLPFDPVRLFAAVTRGWWKILASSLALGFLCGLAGWFRFDTYYTATVQIIRRELPNSFRASDLGESFKPRQFSVGTVTAMMRSPSLLAKVGAQAKPRISGNLLGSGLTITAERNTDLISITLKTRATAAATSDYLNLYAQEVVELTKSLQTQESAEMDKFLREQLAKLEAELTLANQQMLNFSRDENFFSSEKESEAYLRSLDEAELRIQSAHLERETLNFRIAAAESGLARQEPHKIKLTEARDQLEAMRAQYTDRNPLVIDQKAMVTDLEARSQMATNPLSEYQAGPNTVANSLYLDLVTFKSQRDAQDRQFPQLESYRSNILAKLQGVPEKSLRFAKLKARQTSLEISRDLLAGRQREAQLFSENAPGYYRLFAPSTPDQVEKSGRTKRVMIVTLAGCLLGGVLSLLLVAFVEMLDDRILTRSDLRRVVRRPCLAQLGELPAMAETDLAAWRFRTWSVLQRELGGPGDGSIVLGLLSAKAGEGRSAWIQLLQAAAAEREWRTLTVTNRWKPGTGLEVIPIAEAVGQPQRVTQILNRAGHAVVLWNESWAWNLAQRAQWHAALQEWRALPGLAVLMELPPADRLEAVMLAEKLPHVFWLGQSGATRNNEVASLANTLRLAQVHLTGAFLNRFSPSLGKWSGLSHLILLLALGCALCLSATAADMEPSQTVSANTNLTLSATAAVTPLAPWQQRLTLGPGDIVNLSIYGKKQFTRTEVPVGPDGRISYLQASGVMASGLTIDELRGRLTRELSAFYKNARVIVTPFAWRSKKYYLLGTIMDRGTFYLDQPMTIIEATARARGIATGLMEQNTVEIADLPRTFLIRQNRRLPVDFVKLFQQGDLSQNIQLEPGDYIYFPSSTINEVYVLGAVSSPGTVGVTDKASVLSVITTRGGFDAKAFKQRVLVVRGSLNQPETHIVDIGAVLAGKARDFLVQPKDIVFVAERPWARVEELIDFAIKAFVVTATAEWVNQNVAPLITEPIIPGP